MIESKNYADWTDPDYAEGQRRIAAYAMAMGFRESMYAAQGYPALSSHRIVEVAFTPREIDVVITIDGVRIAERFDDENFFKRERDAREWLRERRYVETTTDWRTRAWYLGLAYDVPSFGLLAMSIVRDDGFNMPGVFVRVWKPLGLAEGVSVPVKQSCFAESFEEAETALDLFMHVPVEICAVPA